uniref:Methyltransferase type 11 domain-containing protein n=1 Tax=Amblyomma triste TaxID=251400 RepID=A0A023GGY8_AMBTT
MKGGQLYRVTYILMSHGIFIFSFLLGIPLLPILLISHRFQQSYFAFVYELCQKVWDKGYAHARRAVLARLNDVESQEPSLKSRGLVRMLEVGAAYGPNLEFVGRPVEYWKVEPNPAFEPTFQKNLAANPKVKMERAFCAFGENMHMLPDGHFDVVLLTYVLCSAKDCPKLVSECKRVLKKGGVLLTCEHVGHKKGTLARFLQDIFAPFATNFTCGCYMNRDSAEVIKSAGLVRVDLQEVLIDIPFMYNRHIFGVATA